jgi:NAD(P)H-nitrite reductase large subunit
MAKPRSPQFGRLDHCECHDISAERIADCIDKGAGSVVAVFAMNRCKLKCGDCVPAIRRAIASKADHQSIPANKENFDGTPHGTGPGQGQARALPG